MERLTERDWKNKCAGYMWTVHPVKDIDDLVYYKKLAEYEDWEERGLLLLGPCKIGDFVWYVHGKEIIKYEVTGFSVDRDGVNTIYATHYVDNSGVKYDGEFSAKKDLGKTLFLSEEEAKKEVKSKAIRKPRVENKYNLIPKDIEKAVILDYDRLHKSPFWRNNVVQAWCLSDGSGKGYYGDWIDSYWIGFYDKDAKAYAGKIRLNCSSYEDMCAYNFAKFFDPKEIENEVDLELQEKLLKRINWLIDEGIIEIPKK